MTTSTAPSVINPDIPPPSRPDVLAPPGDRSLFPDNTTGASNKRTRIVSANVPVVIRPLTTDMSLESSIHAHSLPITMISPNNDKSKFVAFDMPVRQPSPDSDAATIKSSPSRFHAAAYLREAPVAFKEKFTTNHAIYI
ncbi:hypothetical protein RhiirA1_476403 [Rhizophagus irregularis]|uniref:Uncharacterized protein n=1 Tax=Rhizophagus irregularis TaxID=588596 RepID=A0A2N0QV89_9GLOM|nr:hypothetical protein RhiirA1_476403 [Rhizophagus irregularis]